MSQTTIKLLKRFGCGCVGILLEDGRTITVEYCGDCDGRSLGIRLPGHNINPENIVKSEYLTDEDHVRVFESLQRLIALGYRYEDVQRALGIQVTK